MVMVELKLQDSHRNGTKQILNAHIKNVIYIFYCVILYFLPVPLWPLVVAYFISSNTSKGAKQQSYVIFLQKQD